MAVTPSTPAYRFRRGYGEFTTIPTPASTMINPGDLLWSNAGVAACASTFTWDTNLATTQPEFRLKFLGVAMDQKLASDASTTPILVCLRGVFAYPCAALGGALHIGSFFSCAKDAANNSLADQIVANVATFDLGVGLLAEEAAQGALSVMLYIQSYLLYTSMGPAT